MRKWCELVETEGTFSILKYKNNTTVETPKLSYPALSYTDSRLSGL